jgi:hypothetical protein
MSRKRAGRKIIQKTCDILENGVEFIESREIFIPLKQKMGISVAADIPEWLAALISGKAVEIQEVKG